METTQSMPRARSYQLEMLEQSLQGNIIVAMDTGSGKTQIAILRIMEELDRCSQDKLVWFLAPTVALCTQQHDALRSQLPAARTRLMIGADNVDRWLDQRLWDAVLGGVRIVVSTHAILLHALENGFVPMTRLALLIFDEEAHHCRRKHPANRIMQDFYHPRKMLHGPTSVPHVLGLTASPVVRSKVLDLDVIEKNLDSICRTPRQQREEMLKFAYRPVLKRLYYGATSMSAVSPQSTALCLLRRICEEAVPEFPTATDQQGMPTTLPITGYQEQLIKFLRKANHVQDELGAWAADYFILESIKALRQCLDAESKFILGFRDDEKTKLLRVLNAIPSRTLTSSRGEAVMAHSAKVERLISFLADQDPERCSGLIFVQQRAIVSALHALLSRHPRTEKRYRCATFVGLSTSAKRRYSMDELLDMKAQGEGLTELKAQVKNIIIATDVLEEGIDVTACNLVVCFDIPSNLKSFLQRRGRARQEQSTFAILLPDNGENEDKIPRWQQLEEDMIQLYQDETRSLHHDLAEKPAENVDFVISVSSTGARLNAESTLARLYHFCALLPPKPYVDLRPAFAVAEDPLTGLFTCTVTLPNCVNALVRCVTGQNTWKTKKAAIKDAAFQAYKALFHAGLLNEHLLPLKKDPAFQGDTTDEFPAVVEVSAQLNPWLGLAKAWSKAELYQTHLILQEDGTDHHINSEFCLISPSNLPPIKPIKMYWSGYATFTLRWGSRRKIVCSNQDNLHAMRETTKLIELSVHSDRMPDGGNDFIMLFTPSIEIRDMVKWLESNRGRNSALEHFRTQPRLPCRGFVRTPVLYGRPYIFRRWHVEDTSAQENSVELECVPLPRRLDILLQEPLYKDLSPSKISDPKVALRKSERFYAHDATVDLLPIEQARFGLFIPVILQHIEIDLVAQKLCTTILSAVPLKNIEHIITAISCPSAQWVTNYQRLEFIGDSVLKFVVSQQLFVCHPSWHEGYLSRARERFTSNNTLAGAAMRAGLDAFIRTEPAWATSKHYPRISEMRTCSPDKRNLSSKTLADVVEALIGAAYVEGGVRVARVCINTFLPDIHLELPGSNTKCLSDDGIQLTNFIMKAETIVGYDFQNKGLLLESLTHPTCERDTNTESYQRLEFLGDAVLDMLVVSILAKQSFRQGDMTRIKAAIVNGNLLGFLCLGFSVDEDVVDIEETPQGGFESKVRQEKLHFWKFMRSHHQEVNRAQQRSLERFNQLQADILHALETETVYPWALLAQLRPEKFFSDIIESVIGAIFVDSQSDLAPCQRFLDRIGLSRYLDFVCMNKLNAEHPRNTLQRIAGSDVVQYVVDYGHDSSPESYRCTITLGGEVLVTVGGCSTEDEAVTVAAEAAKNLLTDRRVSAGLEVGRP